MCSGGGSPRAPGGPTLGYLRDRHIVLTIDRGEYFQCGTIVPKGSFDAVRAEGLAAFRARIARTAPVLRETVDALTDWEQVKLLSVQVNRLGRWYRDGLLHIGDAAHAMSPAGGVGVNYAIQDAVATANALAGPLRDGRPSVTELRRVQRRRNRPVALMQALRVRQARQLVSLTTDAPAEGAPLRALAFAAALPPLKRVFGRVVGLGFRREHVRSPEVRPA